MLPLLQKYNPGLLVDRFHVSADCRTVTDVTTACFQGAFHSAERLHDRILIDIAHVAKAECFPCICAERTRNNNAFFKHRSTKFRIIDPVRIDANAEGVCAALPE